MLRNNHMIFDLEKALAFKVRIDNRGVSEPNRHHLAIMENSLFQRTHPVIFQFKITNKNIYLQYCCPLTAEQLEQLIASETAPVLRSGKYLKVGHDTFVGNHYAFASIHFPLEGNAIDFVDAMDYLGEHLERYLECLNPEGERNVDSEDG